MKLDLLDEHGMIRTLRVTSPDGVATTAHVASWPQLEYAMSFHLVQPQRRVLDWCMDTGVPHAMNGGFFTKPAHQPLGELHLNGARRTVRPFRDPFAAHRGALHIDAFGARIGPWHDIAAEPLHVGDASAMQAGPLLVRGGRVVVADDDPEGFATTHASEFDSDITAERLPRMALAITDTHYLGVAIDGRSDDDTGMLLPELADLLVRLGAHSGLNLDGGSSSSLVVDQELRNRPRNDDGDVFTRGYPTPAIVAFTSV